MSGTSENPVHNKVIKKYVDSKQVEVPIAGTGKAGIVKPADGLNALISFLVATFFKLPFNERNLTEPDNQLSKRRITYEKNLVYMT